MPEGFIPPHGNYKKLISYQKAEIIYDATYRFCERFLKKSDRTIDQMVQAARSGKQNIIEGTQASGTSKETEIKLLNVARSSLFELLADYEDFLRVHGFELWSKDSKQARFVRELSQGNGQQPTTYENFREFIETRPSDIVSNIVICLIHQATYLLNHQIKRAELDFLEQGGIRERMTRSRLDARKRRNKEDDQPKF